MMLAISKYKFLYFDGTRKYPPITSGKKKQRNTTLENNIILAFVNNFNCNKM